jgi:alpha-amylase/alpha-mannosidase (GH57 family)
MERYLCIHGHFYQPPRENPWLEAVETQDSAYPYHDWNERVTAECYAPNSASRILDGGGRIMGIVNNYRSMSFNFGPTLLAWMERNTPDVYRAVLDADRHSAELHSGHGNALAQAYNHMIMPLASERDKRTQVIWGIRDFEHRFGRLPEGMWLPETAVDLETLEIMAVHGIVFTILAPHQVSRTRRLRTGRWHDVSGGRIDPTRPYVVRLPSGRSMVIFLYDGPISRAVAFERLLNRGEDLARRLVGGFSDSRPWPQLMHIATDGETYGHHHKFGDMALAYALRLVESEGLARLTNYGEYLAMHPPIREVQIIEKTSWSCAHGIERWRSDCGCNSGGHPGWHQRWRRPLRDALDWLRDELVLLFESKGREYFKDPWSARDDYIDVVLDRSPERRDSFFEQHAVSPADDEGEKSTMLKLMEIERHAMLMYTSCGWFFDEVSGIETVQVMRYAARAIQLAADVFHVDMTPAFTKRLALAESNLAEQGTGADIYARLVEPGVVHLEKVAAHYGVRSIREDYAETDRVYAYSAEREDYLKMPSGKQSLVVGRVRLVSDITLDAKTISFCVVHLGGPIFNGGVRAFLGDEAYAAMKEQMESAFLMGNIPDLVRLMDSHFGMHSYSLIDLFTDEQRMMLNQILEDTLNGLDAFYRQIYEENRLLMEFVREGNMPIPHTFLTAAQYGLNSLLRQVLFANHDQRDRARSILNEMQKWGVTIDPGLLEIRSRRHLESLLARLSREVWDLDLLKEIGRSLEILSELPLEVNLWTMQNLYVETALKTWTKHLQASRSGDHEAEKWIDEFRQVGELLKINTDEMLKGQG